MPFIEQSLCFQNIKKSQVVYCRYLVQTLLNTVEPQLNFVDQETQLDLSIHMHDRNEGLIITLINLSLQINPH